MTLDEHATVEPARPRSVGEQIDVLTREFPRLQVASEHAEAAWRRCRQRQRETLVQLVDLVGRPTAARMLGLAPRELAGMLRSGGSE